MFPVEILVVESSIDFFVLSFPASWVGSHSNTSMFVMSAGLIRAQRCGEIELDFSAAWVNLVATVAD